MTDPSAEGRPVPLDISPEKREAILRALRRGTVPSTGLETFAVGMQRFESVLEEELRSVATGPAHFKAVRGDYGCGKTFFVRWLSDRARRLNFATAEVQISETETPLHKLETVYRRILETLATATTPRGAMRQIIDGWIYTLEEDAIAGGEVDPDDVQAIAAAASELMERRLADIARDAPMFSAALRGYATAGAAGDAAIAEGLLAWLCGQPNVAASAKRAAGVRGDLDHFGAMGFLCGVLTLLRDAGHPGLLLALDEVETLQRMRSDTRDKGLNALRQLMDEIDEGRYPGLYLLITGTPAFFEGPQGVRRLEPLAQRLHVDFSGEPRFDNPRAAQIRLGAFDIAKLCEVGHRVRDVFCTHSPAADRIAERCGDRVIDGLARQVAGHLGGQVGIAPRIFLKKLVVELLDRVEQHADFDVELHFNLTISEAELSAAERQAAGAGSVDDIELDP